MKFEIIRYTKDKIDDVIQYELILRKEEDFWGWEIDKAYIESVEKSFERDEFKNSVSLLAYVDGKVVGRIDSAILQAILTAQ